MKYIDEFRDKRLVRKVAERIAEEADPAKRYRFMEVCGTHTMAIARYGLRGLFPSNIELLSGPGCPVCVTPTAYIDKAIWLARRKGVTVTTFGDMLRVPGTASSLDAARVDGASVRMVYSPLDSLHRARRHPEEEVVFLGVGFETTVPTVARTIIEAKRTGVANFSVLSAHKTMPEALRALCAGADPAIDGFMLPGHVSAVIGAAPYRFLASRFHKRCVIAGFEPLDVMQAVLMLIRQEKPHVEIQYSRITGVGGNALARKAMQQVFAAVPSEWRGIGTVRHSGLAIRPAYAAFDAEKRFRPTPPRSRDPKGCRCGEVLQGYIKPPECPLFGRKCTEEHPVGSCMVSSEGACAAWSKYSH